MPCLFGAAGTDERPWQVLEGYFRSLFGSVESAAGHGVRLGGQAHPPLRAIGASASGDVFGVNGEHALHAQLACPDPLSRLFVGGTLSPLVRGNLAVAAPDGCLTIGADWLSCFPLYYAAHGAGLAFSSHLRPLASAIQAGVDPAGVLQFLTAGFCLNGRTPVAGVRRLLPGQQVSFDLRTNSLRVVETSRLWAGEPEEADDLDHVWELLLDASVPPGAPARPGLMLSAGWDSRVLAAAIAARSPERVLTVSHGQPDQFELWMARRLASAAHTEHVEVALGADALGSPPELDDLFARCESLMFPYWRLSADALASRGAAFAACGVLGEVLGGHYGSMGSRADRFRHVLAVRSGRAPAEAERPPGDALLEVMSRMPPQGPWYLDRAFLADHRGAVAAAYEMDRQETVDRYVRRGIGRADQAVEAFVAEHRAVQMIAQQPLAASARLPVSLPFADRLLLAAVTRLPMRLRLQNELSRRLLARHGRALLRVPLAATCLPAAAPVLLHDAGRVCRRAVDVASDFAFFRTHGRIGRSRPFGWMNFEQVLRPPHALRAIVEDLRSPLFEKQALLSHLDRVEAYRAPIKLAHAYLKIAQADRLVR